MLIRMMYHGGPYTSVTFSQFQLAGTEQGHIYDGLVSYNPRSGSVYSDLLVAGWSGNNGAPPGETFGLAIHSGNRHHVTRVEGDGRRVIGGPSYGAVGATIQNSVGSTFTDCNFHHNRCAQFVVFQSFNTKLYRPKLQTLIPSASDTLRSWPMNLERSAGTELHSPVLTHSSKGRGVHISHSNDRFTANYDGTTRTAANGSLKILGPSYNDIWGDGRLYIESWTPYWTGDSMATPPHVTLTNGTTHLPYRWAHGSNKLVP